MAVVLRSSSDLVYLPDHGFVGEDGAIRILPQLSRQIRRLDISHNLLGSTGIKTLFLGLQHLRMRYSTPDDLWGLKQINLGTNGITDEGLECVLGYAKKDVCMREVLLQANQIELRKNLTSIIHSLNSSNLTSLSLTNNKTLLPSSLSTLFLSLDSPNLQKLYLSACNITPSLTDSITNFLRSPRSRPLDLLELNGNSLGADSVTKIIDTIESHNFTLKQLGLLANDIKPDLSLFPNFDPSQFTSPEECMDRRTEERILNYQVHERLPSLLLRNRNLTKRTQKAALKCLPIARILLNASPKSVDRIAEEVMKDISNERKMENMEGFNLLGLPEEILYLIIKHCSEDSEALSENQFIGLIHEAKDEGSLKRRWNVLRERKMKVKWVEDVDEVVIGLKEEWLKRGKWDKWELDKYPEEGDRQVQLNVGQLNLS
ncbi:hypothetical protein TREMEDRAFT_28352 [Tremella mesenterica DSM 1558]|uniref:uncharacterized protein n=1 Tax=Tremella mesenterica (strain ATCC 24925 / CBS 8224 / DSM 1558 / NBRC 9311 / NRRL Y-6157 / RJB 2259-6 / UBC 559-6) TaxID=578456 RepID=UPI0003F49D63|nr:uncharacterized protein TREMEDRAFT_28352 [Tremella mesenterica DSM 1558]EIW71098.1 hypothetical protein TREMEDRAFT_28352 [Tremella mesenterica DSM 1558]